MRCSHRWSLRAAALFVLALLAPMPTEAQPVPPPGRAMLFTLDLAGTPVGEIPAAIKQLQGILEVVLKDGVPMLKASARSEFLITLPQVLPADFTLEFELVPKACCNPQDLSFEGTAAINQGAGSAHVLWDSDGYLAVIGGGETYQSPMPEEFQTTLPGVLTQVVATLEGATLKLHTNGRRLYTLSDRQFARGRVLRVFLGGQDDGANAVHLAALRVVAGAVPPVAVATNPTPPPGQTAPPPGQPTPPRAQLPGPSLPVVNQPGTQQQTASQSFGLTGTLSSAVTPSVSVKQGALGPVVDWTPVISPGVYTVQRSKIDDAVCCNNSSPASPPVTAPPWQDGPLPLPGTYVYQVTLTTNSGAFSGQTQYVYQTSPLPVPASSLPATTVPPPPPAPPTAPPTPTVATPIAAQAGRPIATTTRPPPSSIVLAGPPPQNVNIFGTPAYANVGWSSPISGLRGLVYSVQRSLESNPTCCNAQVNGLTTTRWIDEGVQWPGAYIYRITVPFSDGSVGSVDTRWVRPDPVNPTNFRSAAVSAGSVTLQWDPVLDASWYELSGPGVPFGKFAVTPPVTLFTVRNLAPGTYTWRVGTIYSSPNAPAPVSSAVAAFSQLTVTVP